jgi:hypothetical protein
MDNVNRQINSMEEAEAKQLEAVLPQLSGGESYAQQAIWQGHMEFSTTLPKAWRVNVEGYVLKFNVMIDGKSHQFDSSGTFTKKQSAPRVKSTGYYNDSWTPEIKFDIGATPPELQPVLDYLLATKQREERWEKVRLDVKKFLGSCKSVNEAIKLWPDIVMYLPGDVVEKVAEKKTQAKTESTAAAMLSSMNTDELTSAAVIARLSGFKK